MSPPLYAIDTHFCSWVIRKSLTFHYLRHPGFHKFRTISSLQFFLEHNHVLVALCNVHNFSSLERQRRYWGDCPLCLFIFQVTTFLVPLVIQCTWNASEEDNQQSSLWNTILNNLLVILAFKVLPPPGLPMVICMGGRHLQLTLIIGPV